MKWTKEQTAELKRMCFDDVSNKDLAAHFGVPATEIHAKRSQLDITIPKVAAAKGKPGMVVRPEFEAAIAAAEKLAPPKKGMLRMVKAAMRQLTDACLLAMGSDSTSVAETELYGKLCEELDELQGKYDKLLREANADA